MTRGESGGFEERLSQLERDVAEIKTDLKTVLADLADLKGRIEQTPTTIQLIGFAAAILVAAGITHWFGK